MRFNFLLPALLNGLWLALRVTRLSLFSRKHPLPGGVLDPQIRLVMEAQRLSGALVQPDLPASVVRQRFQRATRWLNRFQRLEKVAARTAFVIPGPAQPISVRLYLPHRNPPFPLFVLYHGGGWVLGDLDSHENIARWICHRVGCAVLSVDYRLAPEHPFPAAVEDAYAATQWAAEHAAELQIDADRLIVGGDSAGGNLAAAVCLLARQHRKPRIRLQVLIYPVTDLTHFDTASYREFASADLGLNCSDMTWYRQQYLPRMEDRASPLASPLLAEDLSGLPPALIMTAEFDVLRDEGEAYALRLQEAGVPVRLLRCNGMIHGFASLFRLIRRSRYYLEQLRAAILQELMP